jgi:hypothetical protein
MPPGAPVRASRWSLGAAAAAEEEVQDPMELEDEQLPTGVTLSPTRTMSKDGEIVRRWMEMVLGDKLRGELPAALLSGELLCLLVNRLYKALGMKSQISPVRSPQDDDTGDVDALSNVLEYLRCVGQVEDGVDSSTWLNGGTNGACCCSGCLVWLHFFSRRHCPKWPELVKCWEWRDRTSSSRTSCSSARTRRKVCKLGNCWGSLLDADFCWLFCVGQCTAISSPCRRWRCRCRAAARSMNAAP